MKESVRPLALAAVIVALSLGGMMQAQASGVTPVSTGQGTYTFSTGAFPVYIEAHLSEKHIDFNTQHTFQCDDTDPSLGGTGHNDTNCSWPKCNGSGYGSCFAMEVTAPHGTGSGSSVDVWIQTAVWRDSVAVGNVVAASGLTGYGSITIPATGSLPTLQQGGYGDATMDTFESKPAHHVYILTVGLWIDSKGGSNPDTLVNAQASSAF